MFKRVKSKTNQKPSSISVFFKTHKFESVLLKPFNIVRIAKCIFLTFKTE